MFSGNYFLLFGRNVNHLYFVLPFIKISSDSHSHVTVQKAKHFSISPERFLVTNSFWKLSLSYMPTIQQCIKFKIMKYYLHSSNHVAFIRVCQLNCASLKLFIQVTACSHISHCLSCGAGVLKHACSRWIITFEMIFWNIFNVTAFVLLLCLYDGKSCFACLFLL